MTLSNSSSHVLFVPSWYPTSGHPLNGIFFREQAKALTRRGYTVGVIFPDLRSLRTLGLSGLRENYFQFTLQEEGGIPTGRWHGWNPPISRVRPKLFENRTERLFEIYRAHVGHPDLLHAHSSVWGGVAAAHVSEKFDIPYIISEHLSAFVGGRGRIQEWQKPLLKEAFESADQVLAVSNFLGRHLVEFTEGQDIGVVPNSVDTEFFRRPPRKRRSDPFTFLTISFLNENKRVDILLRAFARAFNRSNSAVLYIGGDGPARQSLEGLAENLEITERVSFLGMLSREQVRQAMWQANTFVLPSRRETFGVVLLEAMATGLPVITTRSGGPEEIVKDSVGRLVPSDDVETLAEGLSTGARAACRYDPSVIREYAVECYGEETVVRLLAGYYERVTGIKAG